MIRRAVGVTGAGIPRICGCRRRRTNGGPNHRRGGANPPRTPSLPPTAGEAAVDDVAQHQRQADAD
jgi:hypothetical protein